MTYSSEAESYGALPLAEAHAPGAAAYDFKTRIEAKKKNPSDFYAILPIPHTTPTHRKIIVIILVKILIYILAKS